MMSKKDEALKEAMFALEVATFKINKWTTEGEWTLGKETVKVCYEALLEPIKINDEVGEAEIKQMLDDIEWYQNHTEELEKELSGKNWQELTEDEVWKVFGDNQLDYTAYKFAKAIEQKLKEKNHGTT